MTDQSVEKLSCIGLSESKARETCKNKQLTSKLLDLIEKAKQLSCDPIPKSVGTLIYHMATKLKPQFIDKEFYLLNCIMTAQITSEMQLNAAMEYFLTHTSKDIDKASFDAHCGIGVKISPEEIDNAVESVISKHRAEILDQRYKFNSGKLLGEIRSKLKWADPRSIKNEIDIQIMHLLGPRTEEDDALQLKIKTKQPPAPKEKSNVPMVNGDVDANNIDFSSAIGPRGEVKGFMDVCGEATKFHKVGENYKTDGYIITPKTHELLQEHVKQIKGQVVTRFPPEPNGILHIGHAKAINFNFGYAQKMNGICYLRYDDTNPEKEEKKYFDGILDMVQWLGYSPYKVTHSSDYFQELYDLAVELIKRDHAYVCHQTADELKGHNPPPSPYRNRPIEESLLLFEDMRRGKVGEGEATLRMKVTLEDGKQDPVAYRIKFCPHHKSGDQWCIYPTYDYTHCLCDSIENITHSLCTKEFQSRRSSYYWLCNALDVYCPVQWEYGRLNLNYTVVSKRKILRLINEGIVPDWDDPRLFTLTALRRRGCPPEAINLFCARVGVTMSQTVLDPSMLDACVRDVLNATAPRAMAVLEPLKVTITNLDSPRDIDVPDFPSDESRGSHRIPLTSTIYIEASDFRETADKNYKRFAIGQPVGLRHAGLVLFCDKVEKDKNGKPCHIFVHYEPVNKTEKPKGFIHWVASDSLLCEVRLYERLFDAKNPEDCPDGFLSVINKNSLTVIENALVDLSVKGATTHKQFQFERNGFFSVDPDTTSTKMIFNRTVTLKENPGKNA